MKDLRIAVSGKSGCGNTTVSKILAEQLGLRFINFTFRSLAEEKGISLPEVLSLAAKDDWWDKEVDRCQLELARKDGGCILGSRLAIWMLKEADLKVYLRAKPEVRASRIFQREGGSLADIAAFTAERDRQDNERYKHIYDIDNDDYSFADIVIDTDTIEPLQIAELIKNDLKQKGLL
jgi:cytidylate kinase